MNTKEKIINAAVEVFAVKGMHGTTMEEVAKKAGVNKSMVYYYYGDKDELYRETLKSVFENNLKNVFARILKVVESPDSSEERLRQIIGTYYDLFQQNIIHTKIIHDSLINHPEYFKDAMSGIKKFVDEQVRSKIITFFRQGMENGEFRKIDPRQIMVSIVGMTMIYFVGRPFAKIMLDLKEEEEGQFVQDRKKVIIDLLLRGIVKDK